MDGARMAVASRHLWRVESRRLYWLDGLAVCLSSPDFHHGIRIVLTLFGQCESRAAGGAGYVVFRDCRFGNSPARPRIPAAGVRTADRAPGPFAQRPLVPNASRAIRHLGELPWFILFRTDGAGRVSGLFLLRIPGGIAGGPAMGEIATQHVGVG